MTKPNTNELRAEIQELLINGYGVFNKGDQDRILALFNRHHNALISKLIGEAKPVLYVADEKNKKIYSPKPELAVPVRDIILILEKEVKK